MSDKFTEVETEFGGLGEWGHVSHDEALRLIEAHYRREAETAAKVLAEIAAGRVRVFHQYGPYARLARREVPVLPAQEGDQR